MGNHKFSVVSYTMFTTHLSHSNMHTTMDHVVACSYNHNYSLLEKKFFAFFRNLTLQL